MQLLIPALWMAGGVQLIIAASNFVLPQKLKYRENLSRVSPVIRQIFIVHSIYILIVLLLFAGLCVFFAPELAGGSRLGRFLSAAMAAFWLLRIPLQLFFYDRELRRANRALDVAYTFAVASLAIVFTVAALQRVG
jgi:hypothetical protein